METIFLGFIWLLHKLIVTVTFIVVREYYEVLKLVLGLRVRLGMSELRAEVPVERKEICKVS